jgi:hypothetical protein
VALQGRLASRPSATQGSSLSNDPWGSQYPRRFHTPCPVWPSLLPISVRPSAAPKPDPVAEMRKEAMASALQVVDVKRPMDEPQAHEGAVLLLAGTYIPISLVVSPRIGSTKLDV